MQVLPWIGYVLVAVLVILFVRWFLSLRRVVRPSEVHVVRRSKKTEIYGDTTKLKSVNTSGAEKLDSEVAGNAYYDIPTWIPRFGVVVQKLPLNNFSVDLKGYEAYDKDKLPFVVDITAFFRIDDYKQAASRIEDNKTLIEHLKTIVQGAVRTILAKDTLDQIMIQRSVYGKQFTTEVENNLREWGIVPVKSIELMDVRDKDGEHVIDDIMKKKKSFINAESRKEVAKNNQEAKLAEIEAEKEIALRGEEKEEAVGKRKAAREEAVGIAGEQQKQKVNEEAKITKEKEMEVTKVGTVRQAEINKEAAKINAESLVQVAEQNKAAAEFNATAELITKTKEAEANLVLAEKEAKGTEVKGAANALAEEKLGLARVQPQITLAKEIGENKGYQSYLIEIRRVEASQAVGVEQAKNLGNAQIKIVANAGDSIQGGVNSVMDLFTAKGGQSLGSMLEAFAGTEQGQKLLSKVFGKSEDTPTAPIEPKPEETSTAQTEQKTDAK